MRVSRGVDVPPVDIVQARRILKVAKGYKELKEKMEILIAEALESKEMYVKDESLRMLRMML